MDSTSSPNVNIVEGEGVGVHSLARNTGGGMCWSPGMGTKKID